MLLYPIVDSGLSVINLVIVLDLFSYFGADFAFVIIVMVLYLQFEFGKQPLL